MHPLLLAAALLAPPQDSAVLLVRVLDVSSARIGGDAILVTDSGPGRARHVLIDASDRALLRDLASRSIPVVTVDTGVRRLTLGAGPDSVTLVLFAPRQSCRSLPGAAPGDAVNNCSVGVRIERHGFAMLLPGDAQEAEQGWWMIVHPALLRADVLKAGHHGSSNGTNPALLDVVRPQAVVISANGRQHPFAGVLALLAARGIPTYCTADAGTITVRVPRAGGWTISTERAAACHARTMR